LKLKVVAKDLVRQFSIQQPLSSLKGVVLHVEEPNNRIYKFDGHFDLANYAHRIVGVSSEVPLSNDNVALRGMSLKNTESVVGIVVYTGHDSKIFMNSTGAGYKTSHISRITNKQIFLVFLIQMVLAALGSIIGTTW